MKIEIWTDIICPWCGLGTHRLNQAVGQSGEPGETQIVHRSFQLNPRSPEGVAEPAFAMLRRVTGLDSEQLTEKTQYIEQLAHDEGIDRYHVSDNNVGNTALAHEFLAYATELGKHTEAWSLIYNVYFGNRAPIWTVDDLLPLAGILGLPADGVRETLTSRRLRDHVLADQAEAERLGASGVPFIVIDGRYQVSGAQTQQQLSAIIERARTVGASTFPVTQ